LFERGIFPTGNVVGETYHTCRAVCGTAETDSDRFRFFSLEEFMGEGFDYFYIGLSVGIWGRKLPLGVLPLSLSYGYYSCC
jgi:hypothetical protein